MARFIPKRAYDLILTYSELGKSHTQINQALYREFPNQNKRKIRHWTTAFMRGNFEVDSIVPHEYGVEAESVVPKDYSQRDNFFEEVAELHRKVEKEKRLMKIVNSQDSHIEDTDPALIELRNQIVYEFEPDIFPLLMDDIDNKLISPHEKSHYLSGYGTAEVAGVQATLDLTEMISSSVRSIVGKDCLLVDGGGNHNDWLLKLLMKEGGRPFASNFFKQYFDILQKHNVYWVDGHKKNYLPLTDSFIFMHGCRSRQNYGSTASSYLKQYGGDYSVCAGHTHRQETMWTRPSPKTGERYFANICGTLGNLQPDYAKEDYLAHNWGFSLISIPTSGMLLASVEDIVIQLIDGYYMTTWRGKVYKEKATKDWSWLNPY